jgi:zinc and cadmium transporter
LPGLPAVRHPQLQDASAGKARLGTHYKALLFNVLSATSFLVGGVLAYVVSFNVNVDFLIPFAAGNFIYIGASDLVPEVNKHDNVKANVVHFAAFVTGLALMGGIRVLFG